MKVKYTLTFDAIPTKPEEALSGKDKESIVGMLRRHARNRLQSLLGRELGGDPVSTGWEVTVDSVEVVPVTKT